MNLTLKSGGIQTVVLPADFPMQAPRFNDEALRKDAELSGWQEKFDRWWYETRTVLLRHEESLRGQLNGTINDLGQFESSTNGSIQELRDLIAALTGQTVNISALQQQLDALTIKEGVDFSSLQTQVNAINASITNILALIAALTPPDVYFEFPHPSASNEWNDLNPFPGEKPRVTLVNADNVEIGTIIDFPLAATRVRALFGSAVSGTMIVSR